MLWPDKITLAGVAVPLADVLADLTIHHGRESLEDAPTATTLQVTIDPATPAAVAAFEVGQTLELTVRDGAGPSVPRFTGYVTDGTLDVDRLTIIGVGEVSRLRRYVIGKVDWPAETWSARVTRAFTEAGLAAKLELVADPGFNPQLAARVFATADATTLGDYLEFLAPMIGALVSDRPDGKILVQAVGARTLDAATPLDPADVAYAPVWIAELPRGNIVTVRYQADQGESVTVTDAASVGLYGDRPETIDTSFVSAGDATKRANTRLGRAAFSHWNVPRAPVLRGLTLAVGAPVLLDSLPATAPSSPWTPVLEGWTDEIVGADWTMTLALSDPLLSGLTIPWRDVPATAGYHWNTIDTATDWTEALTLDDLELN